MEDLWVPGRVRIRRRVVRVEKGSWISGEDAVFDRRRRSPEASHKIHHSLRPLYVVSRSLYGEKFSKVQASRDPDNYFNIRMLSCPAAEMVDGSQVLYLEQAFWRTPQEPFRQILYMVKPCPKELKCDVEVSSYGIRDVFSPLSIFPQSTYT